MAPSAAAELFGRLDEEIASREGLGKAGDYLQKHKVKGVLLDCLSLMLEKRPADSKKFVLDHLEKVKAGSAPAQLSKEDLETMFDMFDVMEIGKISTKKVDEAFKLLRPEGLRSGEKPPVVPIITGGDQMVSKAQFVASLEPLL
jgi:hypothetical protein